MPALVRLEKWSNRESAAGVRTGVVLSPGAALKAEDYRELSGREELELSIDPFHDWASTLTVQQVVRTVFSDDAYDEWRVWEITQGVNRAGVRIFEVLCRSIRFDLANEIAAWPQADQTVLLHHELGGITPDQYLDALVANARWPADFVKGTVDSGPRQTFTLEWDTFGSALDEAAVTTGKELDVTRNGTTQYVVDLIDEIRAGETAEIRFGDNLLEAKIERDFGESGTLIYPKGDGPVGSHPTIANMRWVARTGEAEPTTDWQILPFDGTAAGGGGYRIAFEDDQLNGLYLDDGAGNLYEIIDSAIGELGGLPAPDRFQVTLDTAVSALDDRLCRLRENSDGDELTYIPVPSRIALYGRRAHVLERQDIPGITNLVHKPFVLGTEDLDWEKIGAPTVTTVSEPDPKVHYGDSAGKVEADEGEGVSKFVEDNVLPKYFHLVTEKSPYLSFEFFGFLEAGSVKFEVDVAFAAGDPITIPSGTSDDGTPILAAAYTPGAPLYMTIEPQTYNWYSIFTERGIPTEVRLKIVALEDSTVVYADAYQVTNSAVIAQKFALGSAETLLWDAATRGLDRGLADPIVRLQTAALDKNRLDAATYPYNAMHPGVAARVVAPGIDETRRIFSVRRDLKREALTELKLVEADSAA